MMKKRIPWIALGIALIDLFIILLYALHVNNVINICPFNSKHTDVIGIIISSVALVVSIYFLIIGLHARTIKKEYESDIKRIKEDFDDLKEDFGNLHIEANNVAAHNAKVVYDYYSSSIEMLKIVYNNLPLSKRNKNKGNYQEYIDKIKLARSRFVCNTSCFHELGILLEAFNILKVKSRDKDDLDLLDKVIFNSKNDKDIINAARFAQKVIMKRLGL